MALFEKGDTFGLSGYLQVGENGFNVFHLSFIYASIFLINDGKGLTCDVHGLHMDDCVVQYFLKLCIPLKVHMVTFTSIVSLDSSH